MNEDINSLIQRYVDDRDDLSESELESLTAALRDSSTVRLRLRDQLVMNELICQQVAVDRRNFPAQIDQRLRDAKNEDELASQVREMQTLASAEFDQWSDRQTTRKHRTVRWAMSLAVVAVLLALAGVGAYQYAGPIGRFEMVQGDVKLIRDGFEVEVRPGRLVFDGDILVTSDSSSWSLDYAMDGSRLSGRGEGQLTLVGRRWDAKHIEVASGDVSADAKPQANEYPMRFKLPVGEAIVLGTEFHIWVEESQSRLDVEHGAVRFQKNVNGEEGAIVRTGEYATASSSGLSHGATKWPMTTDGVVVESLLRKNASANVHLASGAVAAEWIPRGELDANPEVLQLKGGAYQLAPFAVDEIVRRTREANAFAIELLLKHDRRDQPAKAKLLSFGPEKKENLALSIESNAVIMQMAFAAEPTQHQKSMRLCSLEDGKWRHVVLTYGDGQLTCYVDGAFAQSWSWQGNLSPWAPGYFMLGDELGGDGTKAWGGELRAIAVYDRQMPVQEAFRNWRRLRADLED